MLKKHHEVLQILESSSLSGGKGKGDGREGQRWRGWEGRDMVDVRFKRIEQAEGADTKRFMPQIDARELHALHIHVAICMHESEGEEED